MALPQAVVTALPLPVRSSDGELLAPGLQETEFIE